MAEPIETKSVEEPSAGVPDGTVIATPGDLPNEVVVYDYDEDGNVIGWHKEVTNG